MIIDLVRLKNKIDEKIEIKEEINIEQSLLSTTDIIAPLVVLVEGLIQRNSYDGFDLQVTVKGMMTLPCSITLEPVSVPFTINIDGNLEELLEEINENQKKIENSIDILPIIWENILMEIPMKVTSPNAYSKKVEGEGWRLLTGEEEKEINPALEQLKDL